MAGKERENGRKDEEKASSREMPAVAQSKK